MAVPKRKVSKSRVRMRKAVWASKIPQAATQACPATWWKSKSPKAPPSTT